MSDNWVVGMLQNGLDIWNSKLNEIWQLITQTPDTFKNRNNLECYHQYKWCIASNRISSISNILYCRNN